MTIHPIFTKSYLIWWFILATVIALKIILFGLNEGGLSDSETYQDSGTVFWIIGILFTAIVFSTPFYLIYRLISKKWNNDVYMVMISVFVGILSFTI
jgi:putative effector of murein hydrolase